MTQNKNDFEPFQRVLVRDLDDEEWNAKLFSRYNNTKFSGYPYLTTCLRSWTYCIPYKGNEHLNGTCIDPCSADAEIDKRIQREGIPAKSVEERLGIKHDAAPGDRGKRCKSLGLMFARLAVSYLRNLSDELAADDARINVYRLKRFIYNLKD